MKGMGPYHYKVWIISEILDKYEDYKNGARLPRSKLFVVPLKKEERKRRGAYFENLVIYAVDIEKIINSLESPLKEIIERRYFERDIRTFMEEFKISSRREARKLIVRAVNKFYDLVERYKKSAKIA